MGPLRPPSAGIPNYNTFDDKHLIGMSLSCNRIVVSTSRCGRDNPGSNPGYSIFSRKTSNSGKDHYKKKFKLEKIGNKMKKRVGLKTYKVRVETGKKNKCGTEARVFITLFGSKGKSTKTRIFKFSGNGAQNPDHVSFKAGFQNDCRLELSLT